MAGAAGKYKILIVDDEVNLRQGLTDAIESPEFSIDSAESGDEAVKRILRHGYNVVVTDLRMPGPMDGYDVLREAKQKSGDTHVIVITAYGTIDGAVEAMKMGAYDFITKPIDIKHFRILIQKAVANIALLMENRELKSQLRTKEGMLEITARSTLMQKMMETARQIAPSMATVLIQGESGTGKELLARTIHRYSNISDKPFVTINCGALPETLFESEMFGHEQGSFTGAMHQKKGVFELAHGGTLLLDEITEIPEKNQVDLLRVIQEGEIKRVGGTKNIKVDCRIVATTNRNIRQLIAENKFREDLYYRLNVIPLVMPPLRERGEDLPLLVDLFLKEYALIHSRRPMSVSTSAMEMLTKYGWPGNIRQLRNVVERLVLTSVDETLNAADLPQEIQLPEKPQTLLLSDNVESMEREVIQKALREANNRREKAANLLGISLRSLHYKLRQYNISKT